MWSRMVERDRRRLALRFFAYAPDVAMPVILTSPGRFPYSRSRVSHTVTASCQTGGETRGAPFARRYARAGGSFQNARLYVNTNALGAQLRMVGAKRALRISRSARPDNG